MSRLVSFELMRKVMDDAEKRYTTLMLYGLRVVSVAAGTGTTVCIVRDPAIMVGTPMLVLRYEPTHWIAHTCDRNNVFAFEQPFGALMVTPMLALDMDQLRSWKDGNGYCDKYTAERLARLTGLLSKAA